MIAFELAGAPEIFKPEIATLLKEFGIEYHNYSLNSKVKVYDSKNLIDTTKFVNNTVRLVLTAQKFTKFSLKVKNTKIFGDTSQ
ncbi:hypothetical protein PVL30_001417 [Lodderomyces elongisporus]|uniref:uncharacterized protein n=1 Tax=Lodderomyces elongisporus TaxID=36914 RepID=UPI002921738C|nr:uncharacterized protein PVL30_001417 [Lodderomyces elongisporus]WLF77699.1 hypothetical protein PVL30_001417 [Lodderomyces elongisporus]